MSLSIHIAEKISVQTQMIRVLYIYIYIFETLTFRLNAVEDNAYIIYHRQVFTDFGAWSAYNTV